MYALEHDEEVLVYAPVIFITIAHKVIGTITFADKKNKSVLGKMDTKLWWISTVYK